MALSFIKAVEPVPFYKAGKSLVEIIKENMAGREPARSHATMHASDLTKPYFCPREVALMLTTNTVKKSSYIPVALRVTFDAGEMTSDLVRTKWLGQYAVGNWQCAKCGTVKTMTTNPGKVSCKAGNKHSLLCLWGYKEVRFEHAHYKVSGGIDVLVNDGTGKLLVVEIKTMSATEFDKLLAPLAEHRLRTNLYMNLIENSMNPWRTGIDTKQARVLYISRGHGKKDLSGEITPFKEFLVDRDDSVLQNLFVRAEQIMVYKKEGLIPNGICDTSFSPAAKQCSCTKACFSGHFPHQQPAFPL